MDRLELAFLAAQYGIHLGVACQSYMPQGQLALDAAQPQLITVGNAGIPAYLTNYVDPEVIRILVTPNDAVEIFGEAKKGDWTVRTATFPVVESTGEVSSYGDYNNNGSVGYNTNFPQRQSYHYQTIAQWGDLEMEMSALAKIDAASQTNISAATTLSKYQNLTYFFGVAGMQNYGILNDPMLLPPIAPGQKAYNSNLAGPWITNGAVTATGDEVYKDIQTLFGQLVSQSFGLIDMKSKMTLAMSPGSEVALTTTNQYNVNVNDQIKKNFPNLTVKTAAQYANSTTGNMMQLIADSVDGQQTGYCSFTEKMRAHRIVPDLSSFKQKKSQGTWGAIVRLPFAMAMMVGI